MNKTDMINAIAEEAGLTKAAAKKALEAFINATANSMKKGEKVSLLGFGTFSVVEKTARMGRNPRTGAPVKIPARKAVKFKPGAGLQA